MQKLELDLAGVLATLQVSDTGQNPESAPQSYPARQVPTRLGVVSVMAILRQLSPKLRTTKAKLNLSHSQIRKDPKQWHDCMLRVWHRIRRHEKTTESLQEQNGGSISETGFAIEDFQPLHVKRAIENGRRNRVRHLKPDSLNVRADSVTRLQTQS